MAQESQVKDSTWRIIPAAVAGTSHIKRGLPCQDSYYWEILPPGILVTAVADGAGSAKLAEIGSEIAAGAVVETVRKNQSALHFPPEDEENWREFLLNCLKVARVSVAAEAATRNVKVRDLASTLILVIAKPEMVALAQVGDGAAVIEDSQGNLISLSAPDSGEFINETSFLVSQGAIEAAQIKIWQGKAAKLAVFSDGLQLLALQMASGLPYPPFFQPLFRFLAEAEDEKEAQMQLQKFLVSHRVTERTDDDVTLFLAALV